MKNVSLISGPVSALLFWFVVELDVQNHQVSLMAGVVVWMAIWWLTEAVPLAITSLLPVILLPLLGIADSKVVCSQYMDSIIFLFIGGFLLAFAIERWQLHHRMALKVLLLTGSTPTKLLVGIMLTAYLLSMWVSNTATVMILISAVSAAISQLELSGTSNKKVNSALMLGLAYAASIGGMATLVGTPTNMIFYREYLANFPQNHDMNFFEWFKVGLPISLLMLFGTFLILRYLIIGRQKLTLKNHSNVLKQAYLRLGKLNYEEKVVSFIFLLTVMLWFTRAEIDMGNFTLFGWNKLFSHPEYITDATVVILMSTLLFFIPSKSEKGSFILTWSDAEKLPFNIILLFGGGFAMAKGFELSGLSNWVAGSMNFLQEVPPFLFIIGMCLLICIISEFASNVACIQLMLPVLAAFNKEMNLDPLVLMIPATLAASLGFVLPIATAPNTIVFATGKVKAREMFRAGIWVDIIGIIIIAIFMYLTRSL